MRRKITGEGKRVAITRWLYYAGKSGEKEGGKRRGLATGQEKSMRDSEAAEDRIDR